jgi:iron complex outermembrane receptor protein
MRGFAICRIGIRLLASAAAAGTAAGTGCAQAATPTKVSLSIAPQPLASALNEFARQSRQQLLFTPELVAGKQSRGLTGPYAPNRALSVLLAGTGLTYRAASGGVFVLLAAAHSPVAPARAGRAPLPPASAPAEGAATDGSGPGVGDIIVTAQRRSESIQRVPATITAFTGAMLEAEGVQNTADLQLRTPGFIMSSNVVFGQPFLRGVGNATLTIGSDSSVATYVDGVYLTRPMSSFQEFLDVDRVEVLKGPQGTLYGRNATGGVINIITEDPTDHFYGRAEATVGNYGTRRFSATLSGPLAGPGLTGRLSVMKGDSDGYVRNLFDNSRLETENTIGARAKLQAKPADNFTLTLAGDIFRENDTRGQGLKTVVLGAGSAGTVIPPSPDDVDKDYHSRTYAKAGGVSLRAEWDLGGYALSSITAYRHSEFNLALDLDLSARPFANVDPELERSDTWTQELQITSPKGQAFEWLAGAFYLAEDASTQFNIHLTQSGISQNPTGFNQTRAYAVYAQGSLWLVPQRLRVTVGGRYSDEDKQGRVITNFPAPTQTDAGQRTWNAFTPHFDIDFFPTRSVMLYASATRGFKSGGFNATARGLPAFNPEYIWSYEGGIKSTFANGHVRANLSAFHYDYKDLQVRALVSGIISGVTNAAKATIEGAEAQLSVSPVTGLSIDVGAAYLNARFDQFVTTNPDVGPASIDLKGNRLSRAPANTLTVGASYTFGLGSAGKLLVRGDYQYQSRIFFDEFNDPTRSQKAFATLSARASWSSPDDKWSISLWARNLTDVHYITNALRSAGTYGTAVVYAAPRTYGLTVGAHF